LLIGVETISKIEKLFVVLADKTSRWCELCGFDLIINMLPYNPALTCDYRSLPLFGVPLLGLCEKDCLWGFKLRTVIPVFQISIPLPIHPIWHLYHFYFKTTPVDHRLFSFYFIFKNANHSFDYGRFFLTHVKKKICHFFYCNFKV